MNWGSASNFFAMGGYAFYVWSSFIVFAVALAIEVWLVRHRARKAIAQLKMMHKLKSKEVRDEATA